MARNKRQVRLAHPGEILNEEFLKPLAMTLAASVPIRRCGSAVTLGPVRSSGSTFRRTTS